MVASITYQTTHIRKCLLSTYRGLLINKDCWTLNYYFMARYKKIVMVYFLEELNQSQVYVKTKDISNSCVMSFIPSMWHY